MATACIPQVTFGFESKGKPVVARFDQPHASSDGGAILLKSVDTHLGLTRRLAGCLVDGRQAGKVRHQLEELLQAPMPIGDLADDAKAWERGVDELAAEDEDVADYVLAWALRNAR